MGEDVIDTLVSVGIKILVALVILAVTWLVAIGVRKGISALVKRVKFLQRTGNDGQSLGESVGKIAALLVWLLGLVAVLQWFNLGEVVAPIQTMLNSVLAFLPNLLGAILVFIVGALLAKVARQLIEAALRALPLDKWLGKAGAATNPDRESHLPGTAPSPAAPPAPAAPATPNPAPFPGQAGQPGQFQGQAPQGQGQQGQGQQGQGQQGQGQQGPGQFQPQGHPGQFQGQPQFQGQAPQQPTAPAPQGTAARIAHLVGTVVYALILIVVTIAALQVLGISAISAPASAMLTSIFDAVPRIVAALLLVGLGVLIAKFLGDLVRQLLEGIGADKALASAQVLPDGTKASTIVARVVQVAVVLFFAVMAAQTLAFPQITDILQQILTLGGQVLFGGVIIAAGFFLGGLIQRLMGKGMATTVIKYVTIVLFAAMGLKAMGIADSIIELGFGAVVVGGALAAALAFGLGGRDAASRTLSKIEHKAEEAEKEKEKEEAAAAAAPAPAAAPPAPQAPEAPGPEDGPTV